MAAERSKIARITAKAKLGEKKENPNETGTCFQTTFRRPIVRWRLAWFSARSWILAAEISELSDFQWLAHQFTTRVFA